MLHSNTQKQEKTLIQEKVNEVNSSQYVAFLSSITISDYKQLLKNDTHEYYLFASNQCTIYPLPQNKLKNILSSQGLALLEDILRKVKCKEFKDSALDYSICPQNSGYWMALKNSRWFGVSTYWEAGIEGSLNTFFNKCIEGRFEKADNRLTTSPCVFIVEASEFEDGWCYTKSGSLYKLNKKSL